MKLYLFPKEQCYANRGGRYSDNHLIVRERWYATTVRWNYRLLRERGFDTVKAREVVYNLLRAGSYVR